MAYYHDYLAVEFGALSARERADGDAVGALADPPDPQGEDADAHHHGENDNDVPIAEAEQFYIALHDVGVPTVLVRYPREGHGLRETAHVVDQLERSIAWYRKYFGEQRLSLAQGSSRSIELGIDAGSLGSATALSTPRPETRAPRPGKVSRVFPKRQTEGSVICTSCGVLVGVTDATCYNCGRRNPGLWGYAPWFRRLGQDLGFVPLVMGGTITLYVIALLLSGSSIQTLLAPEHAGAGAARGQRRAAGVPPRSLVDAC